jgi:hypothetical protein
LADELEASLGQSVDEARAWLDSPAGRQARSIAARSLILATPFVLRHPFFKTPVGRVIEVAGAAALIARIAEYVRDWEAAPGPPSGFTES